MIGFPMFEIEQIKNNNTITTSYGMGIMPFMLMIMFGFIVVLIFALTYLKSFIIEFIDFLIECEFSDKEPDEIFF